MNKIILVAVLLALAGCTKPADSTSSLEGAGYTKIEITGFRFFGCSEDDTFRTGFKAVGPSGKTVTGVVCGGLLKGSTIRLD
jgi:hypothetical protein